jgi:hypothetical protein
MLLPHGGLNWKAAKAQMSQGRVLRSSLTRSRLLFLIGITGIVMLLYRSFRATPPGPQKFVHSLQNPSYGNLADMTTVFAAGVRISHQWK